MQKSINRFARHWVAFLLLTAVSICGCTAIKKRFSDSLTHWAMLDQQALAEPIKAVGGDGIVFMPSQDMKPLGRSQLSHASPESLVSYYSPIFIQQRVDTRTLDYPYPQEYDTIGEAHLRKNKDGKLESYVAGAPKVYAIFKKLPISGHNHVQLTYTAWYPAHPRMKAIDLERADIDSCVVRVTLDAQNAPVLYETIAACGCFHKVFVQRRIEDAARQAYGPPEAGKKYSVEVNVKDSIDWEVAGLVDEPHDQPSRPVVFVKAGDHKVIGMGSASLLHIPASAEKHPYHLTSYEDLYEVKVDGGAEKSPFFDLENGGKVRGGERKHEKFFMSFIGVDAAGQPRADDQIKMHFDESTWGDASIYSKYLRLPLGAL